ncbi:hypothetical protein ES703_55528 [subsurface metagenome]
MGGKGEPEEIWTEVDSQLASEGFKKYISRLKYPKDKVIIFDIENKNCSVFYDEKIIEVMKRGPYPGTEVRIYVLKTETNITEIDIYNYLYCVGTVGLDCSGFIYYIQKSIAKAYSVDLDEVLAKTFHTATGRVPQIMGLWFFDPEADNVERVDDKIGNLRPGDVFLFRGRGYIFRHSAVIQSIDFERGLIRYVQCTDWAPQAERGVHESFIKFDPANTKISLKDDSIEWTQNIYPTFVGETGLGYWKNDGHRYRAYMEVGGSVIIRLKMIKDLIVETNPSFYHNLYQN